MSVLNSPLVKNLENGTLPDVNVTVDNQSIVNLCIAVVIAGTILILVWKIVKNI